MGMMNNGDVLTSSTAIQEGHGEALPKILVVDDDDQILKQVKWAFSDEYEVFLAGDRSNAIDIVRKERIPVILLDLGLPPHPREATEGLATLEEILAENPQAKVIIVSGNSEKQNALRAVDLGAHDIFPKPIEMDDLSVVLKRVYKRVRLEKEINEERTLAAQLPFEQIIGSSLKMRELFSSIRKVANTDVPVLILGESGTGKELVANAIHNLSRRKDGPFAAINCGAIPESLLESELFGHERGSFTGATAQRRGKLEYAKGGTLFLDEIGDLASSLQVKILRFLQERVIERVGGRESISVDSRIVAATHQDLAAAVKEGKFREDLYFRLAVVAISLPPLRERDDDVVQIAKHLVQSFSKELGIAPKAFTKQALAAMKAYDWPGNVRELQNRIKRALVLSDSPNINPAELELDVPSELRSRVTLKKAREKVERDEIARALQENNGNISRTAKALGISRPTLYELLTRYGLS
jgi:two-component system, NtrC family, response regulator